MWSCGLLLAASGAEGGAAGERREIAEDEAGEVEGRHLDAAFARNLPPTAARPAVQRWRIEGDAERELCFSSWVTSGRQQSLARIESWLKEQLRVPVGPGSGG